MSHPTLLQFQMERRPCRILNIAWIDAVPKAMTREGPLAPRTALALESFSPLPVVRSHANYRNCLLNYRKSRPKRLKANICPPRTEISDDARGLFKTCGRVPIHGGIFQRK